MEDVAVSVHRYQGDAGAGQEHSHALDAANRLAQPGLEMIFKLFENILTFWWGKIILTKRRSKHRF